MAGAPWPMECREGGAKADLCEDELPLRRFHPEQIEGWAYRRGQHSRTVLPEHAGEGQRGPCLPERLEGTSRELEDLYSLSWNFKGQGRGGQ